MIKVKNCMILPSAELCQNNMNYQIGKKKINFAFKDDPGVINRANIKKKYELLRIDTNYFKI